MSKRKPDYFKNAARISLQFAVHRYLQSNSKGRLNGVEKAEAHSQMCIFYVACKHGIADTFRVRRNHEDEYQLVHEATQSLTSYLDEQIGFPIHAVPDYDDLAPKFFDKFHQIATKALGI
jgi:hypothetical protein